jgi:hypothetical protein
MVDDLFNAVISVGLPAFRKAAHSAAAVETEDWADSL